MPKRSKIVVVRLVLGFGLPALMAAAPASNGFLKQPMMAEATIGPDAQSGPVSRLYNPYTAAPMPDLDQNAPVTRPTDPSAAHVAPRLFHKQTVYHGEGYVFGSTVQEQQDRKVGPAPGINLIMPLQ